jgi:acetyl-CoA C-acetyltransferase
MIDEERIPVVAAAGQTLERDEIVSTEDLVERASRAALDEAAALASRIGRVSVVSTIFSPSVANGATDVSRRLGIAPDVTEVTTAGGNTPQWLVTRAAEDIAAGRLGATLIAGAESTRSARAAGAQQGLIQRKDDDAGDADPIVGASQDGMLSAAEIQVRLFLPAQVYPLFESALAARDGRSFGEQRGFLGTLMAPFARVAASHPYAWFRDPVSPGDIATPSESNRITAEPYTKRMNAFPNVDLGAALVVCSLAEARRAGIADGAVFVWSGADTAEVLAPTARPNLAASPAIAAAGARALGAAGINIDDIDHFDFYSCFPSAVQLGAEAIGLALDDRRGLTVTGGLPYFGGPGNNYPTHSIATIVSVLREQPGKALITGLGGFVTKHAVGIYGSEPPPDGFRRGDTRGDQKCIDEAGLDVALSDADGEATVEASTVVYGAGGRVESVPVIATLDDGRRVAALASGGDLEQFKGVSLVGARIRVGGSPPSFRVEELAPGAEAGLRRHGASSPGREGGG